MLSQRRRAPVSSKLTRCHPTADTPTIDVHVNRVNRDHPLSAIHPARRRPRCPARCCCRRPRRHCRPSFDHVRRLQRGFRCRVMSFPTTDKNPHTTKIRVYVCVHVRVYIVRCFFFHFFSVSLSLSFFPFSSFSSCTRVDFPVRFSSFFRDARPRYTDRVPPSSSLFFLSSILFVLSVLSRFYPDVFSRSRRAEPRISQVGGKIESLTTRPMRTISFTTYVCKWW